MIFETERLILRKWKEEDAENLFLYASNPKIGPNAGWQPHKNIDESLNIIRNVFLKKPCEYAVCLKEDNKPIGAFSLKLFDPNRTISLEKSDEFELGYWIAEPFWGKGLILEAARELMRYAFEDLNMSKAYCRHYDGNTKSKRVIEKLGFSYVKSMEIDVPLLNEVRMCHVYVLTKEDWQKL